VDLAQRLATLEATGERLVLTDGVFSMDGDLAPLPELSRIAAAHNAWFMVDDAHGLGVLGATGAGSLEHFGLDAREVPILMGTLGKAFGTAGAFVAGSEALIETLIQSARTYVYTTAMPAALAEATRASLQIVRPTASAGKSWWRWWRDSARVRARSGSGSWRAPRPSSPCWWATAPAPCG
jgi:8-amino-7-oxononanoate synthase